MDKLILVGSRRRGDIDSDYNYITTYPLDMIYHELSMTRRHMKVKTIKSGGAYIQFEIGPKIINIWRVSKPTLRNNEILRTMDTVHYNELVKACKELDMHLNFNGIKLKNTLKYYDIERAINMLPELEQFKKYIIE